MTNQTPPRSYRAPSGTVPTLQSLSRIAWTVESATAPGVSYEVRADLEDYRLTCNCLASGFDRVCWHVRAVASGKAGKPRVRITVQTRPAPVSPIGDTLPITAVMMTRKDPTPPPSPFRAPTDGVTRGGRVWS